MVDVLLLATTAPATSRWPDGIDLAVLAVFAALAFGVPLVGHVLLANDIRRYLRSLRRALIALTRSTASMAPAWALRGQPPCLQSFNLELPCTEEEVLAAYRRRVKDLHPDKGGDLQQFLQLQRHFEQAMYLARSRSAGLNQSVRDPRDG